MICFRKLPTIVFMIWDPYCLHYTINLVSNILPISVEVSIFSTIKAFWIPALLPVTIFLEQILHYFYCLSALLLPHIVHVFQLFRHHLSRLIFLLHQLWVHFINCFTPSIKLQNKLFRGLRMEKSREFSDITDTIFLNFSVDYVVLASNNG